jgi:hypothetical protein
VDQQQRPAFASNDGVKAQAIGVDVAARERISETGRQMWRPTDGSGSRRRVRST